MVRFHSTAPEKANPLSRSLRVKLWLLLGMLAMVGMMMQHLQKPKTAEQLGRLFSLKSDAVEMQRGATAEQGISLQEDANKTALLPQSDRRDAPKEVSEQSPEQALGKISDTLDSATTEDPLVDNSELAKLLAEVKDNALFLESETPAWLAILQLAQTSTPAELKRQSVGQLAYAQLIEQPNVYRGRVVKLRGTILREESIKPTKNELGIDSYHRLVMRPAGGGDFPFVIYALKLPEGFPRGDEIRVEATVQGYFFKNWSYPHERGLSLAPVVVTPTIDWQPTRMPTPSRDAAGLPAWFWWAAAGMALLATLGVVWLARATGHSSSNRKNVEVATLESLQRMSDGEAPQ